MISMNRLHDRHAHTKTIKMTMQRDFSVKDTNQINQK